MEIETKSFACNICRIMKDDDEFNIKKNGGRNKGCDACLEIRRSRTVKYYCPHKKQKSTCADCDGCGVCSHNRQRRYCILCYTPQKILIARWIIDCRRLDRKNNIYDPDRFIDTEFIKGLMEDNECCYYRGCKIKLQYNDRTNDMATLELLDNSKGHIKSNCVLTCLRCNSTTEIK